MMRSYAPTLLLPAPWPATKPFTVAWLSRNSTCFGHSGKSLRRFFPGADDNFRHLQNATGDRGVNVLRGVETANLPDRLVRSLNDRQVAWIAKSFLRFGHCLPAFLSVRACARKLLTFFLCAGPRATILLARLPFDPALF